MQKYLFESQRLGFRLLEASDVDFLSQLENDPEINPHFHPFGHKDEAIKIKLNQFIASYKKEGLPWFLVFELDSKEYVGRIGLWRYKTGEMEVGFALLKKFWGHGYGTEMLAAVLNWARKNMDAEYIIAVATLDNIASARVLEKCGMEFYKIDVDEGEQCRFFKLTLKK